MINILTKKYYLYKIVIADRADSAPPTGIGYKIPILENLLEKEFIISKIYFNVSTNRKWGIWISRMLISNSLKKSKILDNSQNFLGPIPVDGAEVAPFLKFFMKQENYNFYFEQFLPLIWSRNS